MKHKLPKSNNQEMPKTFSSPKSIVRAKIREFELEIREIKNEIKAKLGRLYAMRTDSFTERFIEQVLEIIMMPKIDALRKNIFRLEGFWRLLNLEDGMKKRIETEEKIERAIKYSIEKVSRGKLDLKPFGEGFVSPCPFCDEEYPSLYIFPEANTFCCFGCQKTDNVIILTMALYGLDFREAVEMLQNQDEEYK